MTLIETKQLGYCYEDGTQALKGVNIRIEEGKTTAILGGNGSGKSTLFLNLNGVFRPSEGQILLQGQPMGYSKKEQIALKKQVGIVFQNADEQLFSANVKKDLCFGLKNLGLSEEEIEQRLEAVVEQTGIAHLLQKPTHALSFGQKKRVALAGVLAMQPQVIILDEPTAGLDPQGVSEILKLVKKLKEELNITVLLSTHEIDLVPLYCDSVYVLAEGQVVFEGTPEELWQQPELLRKYHLRLPRITHLMEILEQQDHLPVDRTVSTIGQARKMMVDLLGR